MSLHSKRAQRLQKYYDTRIRLGDDKDTAVEYGLKILFPLYSEDAQADVFAFVRPAFDDYPSGLSRRIALTTALRKHSHGRILR